MTRKRLLAADLFCGAGGSSTGLMRATEILSRKVELVAVNHWDLAVETHAKNHPRANHFCEDLMSMDPKKAVPVGRLDLLIAAPECTHHSVARGGKPMNDQSRASAWCILRWATALRVDRILIENVREFTSWGPLGASGRPLKSRRGETFAAFVKALESLGYRIEMRVCNAADYGDATTRQRLFIQAALGRRPIRWPRPTHVNDTRPDLFEQLPRWRAAREVIDWSMPGDSIFARKRPLSANTLKRIEAGLRKFGGKAAEPFLVAMNYLSSREHDGRYTSSVDRPVPTITSQGNRFGLVQPYLVNLRGTDQASLASTARPIDEPVPGITAGGEHVALCEPWTMQMSQSGSNGDRMRPVSAPLPTVTTADDLAVVTPFIVPTAFGEREGQTPRTHSVDEPMPTVVGTVAHGVVQPFILPHRQFERMDVDSIDQPLRTITATNGGCHALVEPFVIGAGGPTGQGKPQSIDDPTGVVTTENHRAIVQPFVVKYNGTGRAHSVDEPLDTISTRDRFGLVEVDGVQLDIRFRMLAPHELAGAMGFPSDYKFAGNRGEQVKQIGNAIAVGQAAALCGEMLAD